MSYKNFLKALIISSVLLIFQGRAFCGKFIPAQPVMSVNEIKAGESGYLLTVLKGYDRVKIPVKIIDIMPQKPGIGIKNYILVKILGDNELAKGMSGSPVFVREKIIGAIAISWDFSDHKLAFVTPVEDMIRIFENQDSLEKNNKPQFTQLNNFTISGFKKNSAVEKLARSLGTDIDQGISMPGNLRVNNSELKPGDAVSALLVWGDIEAAATGTVTLTSVDGKFLAFGHEFLKRGNVHFPSARAKIYETVNNVSFPFKLGAPVEINGVITQDREAGIGGTLGIYPQSIPVFFVFKDLDRDIKREFKFRVVNDEFLAPKLLEAVFSGLAEESWQRKGQGTFKINLRLDGKDIPNGWTKENIYFSDEDIISGSFSTALNIIDIFLTQQFENNNPVGIRINVEASEKPRVLIIEDIETKKEASPNEIINVKVKLRLWRGKVIEKNFDLKIPDDASGICELIVRGGSVHPLAQTAVEEGFKSIDSLERLLTEIKALDSNNDLILELNTDEIEKAVQNSKNKNNNTGSDENMIPEENEYLSMTKERRINEGTLKIFTSDCFIDGEMKRLIKVIR